MLYVKYLFEISSLNEKKSLTLYPVNNSWCGVTV